MSPPRSPLRAFFGRYLIAFVAALTLMGGMVFAVNYVIDSKLDDVPRVNVDTAPAPPDGANYLLIGSDTRKFVANETEEKSFGDKVENAGQRSDTMMVVHVEPNAQRTLIVSFPRDLWVEVPGEGESKINAAFNQGGPDKVIETLNANYGIEINHYLEVDFKSFQGIVKAIGSVPVYFPYPARDEKTGLYAPFGACFKLDGQAALAYVRSRGLEYYSAENEEWVQADARADLDRIARQQDFIRKLAGLAVQKSLNNPLTANEIADRVLENLKIDDGLTKQDIFGLIDAFRTVNPDDTSSLEMLTFPNEPGNAGNQSVLFPGEGYEEMVARLADFSGNTGGAPTVAPATVSLKVRNGTGREGEATSALTEFEKLGFRGKGAGNDARGTVAVTEVRYKPGARDKGKSVLSFVEPAARLVEDPDLEGADVAVVIGSDFEKIVVPNDTSTTVAPAPSSAATGDDGSASPTPAPISNESELGPPAPKQPPC